MTEDIDDLLNDLESERRAAVDADERAAVAVYDVGIALLKAQALRAEGAE